MKYNGYLAKSSFIGMIMGPLCYLMMLKINHHFELFAHTFSLPSIFQGIVGFAFSLILYKKLRAKLPSKKNRYNDDNYYE